MDILRNYKYFLKESVDSDKEVKSIEDVPKEVIETSKKIALDIFDRVRRPIFEYDPKNGVVMRFNVTQQDFEFIDENEDLTLDIGEGARKKRTFDVTLKYLDRISEFYEVKYIVEFEMITDDEIEDFEDDEDVIVNDDWEKPEEDFGDFDEELVDQQIKKGKINLNDDDIEIEYENDEEF